MSIFNLFGSYDDLWKAIIMPARQEYSIYDLGPTEFLVKGNRIKRTDFRLTNKRGHTIECSYFQQAKLEEPHPCIVYLHANGCCRLEALHYLELVLANPVSFFCFDFSGCGKSGGLYTSVGWYEQDDLECVIQYLSNTEKVSKIGVWGRSMGAITAILYAEKDPRIDCLILDSPFSNFNQLVKEVAKQRASVPEFLVSGALNIIGKTIKSKANFDIDALQPIKYVDKIKVPALFGTAKDDTFVSPQHTRDLYMAYGGLKKLMVFEGDHNSQRPLNWMQLTKEFFRMHLLEEKVEQHKTLKSFKSYFNPADKQSEPLSGSFKANNENKLHKKTLSPPRDAPGHMKFTWLEHSASSPSLHTKIDSQASTQSDVVVKAFNDNHSAENSNGEKKLRDLLNLGRRNTTSRVTHEASEGTSKLGEDSKDMNNSENRPPLRLIKNASNPASNKVISSITIFGPKQTKLKNDDIVQSLFRKQKGTDPNASLKDISSLHLNKSSDEEAEPEMIRPKIFGRGGNHCKNSRSDLSSPFNSDSVLHSREYKNSELNVSSDITSFLQGNRRAQNSGSFIQPSNIIKAHSNHNKSFNLDSINQGASKENISPITQNRPLGAHPKNSKGPLSSIDLNPGAPGTVKIVPLNIKRSSENVAKSIKGNPGIGLKGKHVSADENIYKEKHRVTGDKTKILTEKIENYAHNRKLSQDGTKTIQEQALVK